MRRRPTTASATAGLAVAGALLAGTLSACGAPAAEAGDVVEAGSAGPGAGGGGSEVVVPAGVLTVSVGTSAAELPEGVGGEDTAAPDGGGWLPVEYSFDPFADLPGRAVIAREPQPTSVRVVLDGVESELPAPYEVADGGIVGSGSRTVYVAWTGEETGMSVEVGYDGLVQTLDARSGGVEPGAAAPLYEPSTKREAACSTVVGDAADARARVSCEATLEELPYLPGTGWAPVGEVFLAAGYRVRVDDLEGYEVTEPAEVSVSFDGGQPLPEPGVGEELGAVDSPEEVTALAVFAAPVDAAGEVVVDARFGVTPDGDPSDRPEPLAVRASVEVD